MAEGIRNLRSEEYEVFMRFVERCFGFSPGMLEGEHPRLYHHPTAELCASAYVIERQGQIVSHVGLYPIEVVAHGASFPVGGIGGVATLPSERGKGYMTQLLHHVIGVMREQGYPLSWLGGDRQRYAPFGWERAGMTYELTFSRRSLARAGAEAVEIEARFPADALDVVQRFHSLPPCHARRPHLALQMRKEGLRAWTTEDGYALVEGPMFEPLSILELVSASGREAGMIRALLDWTGRGHISWQMSAWDDERLARVMPYVSRWRAGGWQMWRIVDLEVLLTLAKPILSRRAAALRDLELAIGIREHDRTDLATLVVHDGEVEVASGRQARRYVEWSSVEAARVLLGGPPVAAEAGMPPELRALLPIPVYVPALEYV